MLCRKFKGLELQYSNKSQKKTEKKNLKAQGDVLKYLIC